MGPHTEQTQAPVAEGRVTVVKIDLSHVSTVNDLRFFILLQVPAHSISTQMAAYGTHIEQGQAPVIEGRVTIVKIVFSPFSVETIYVFLFIFLQVQPPSFFYPNSCLWDPTLSRPKNQWQKAE
jgi:hypothetical protein